MTTQNIIDCWQNGVEPYTPVIKPKNLLPHQFSNGTKVQNIWTGEINTVARSYWQWYAGPPTSDYTTVFVEGGWNKSTNLIEISGA